LSDPRPPNGEAPIRCVRLEVGYGSTALLPPIDIDVRAGEFLALIGRNGSGKTTLFRTMLGLLPPVSGEVVARPNVKVGYVRQRLAFDDLYPVTAHEVVEMGAMRRLPSLLPWGQDAKAVEAALHEVGAAHLWNREFRTLSEGQKQRVLLARMIVSHPDVALLDEPTAAMDAVAEHEAMSLLDEIRRRHSMAMIVVSHHLPVARKWAERVLFVDAEARSVVIGPPDEVFSHEGFLSRYREAVEAGVA
jgi:zinc transport system ATP-binding protein